MVRRVLEDHLACPALERWLPNLLEDDACTWIAPGHRPRRGIARLLSTWSPVTDDASALRALVLATPLPATLDVPASLLARLAVGSIIVDLASVHTRGLGIWRPARRRRAVMLAVAERARHWAERGLVDLEQWAPLDPTSTVVTLGIRGAHMT
jgi:hypothetical protein